jgi:NhaP-type Na+/H+ or K+/H+ antiporter/Trk K+ transport system NAD-binding subunit
VPETILLDVTTVVILGIGAQWLAWRFRLPSILLLLLAGFLAGPVLGVLEPQSLQGDWLFAFVSVSIGIILFEGGLSLRLSELREVGGTVLKLITLGVLVTWGLGAAAAHFILDFNVSLAILIGAILTVTGPTVIVPLLRHVRPEGRVGTIAKWEGITIDPVGAILAVLVLETLILLNNPSNAGEGATAAIEHVAVGIGLEIFVALGVSVTATALLLILLRRRMVPDFLRNPITLMVVIVAFVVSNVLQHEAGLLTTTLMGIALANQPYVSVQRIVEFKENLQVLLIGSLFVLLSARLELSALTFIDMRVLVFLGILVVLVRPLAVWVSTVGTQLSWEERTFLSWLAPRGVVAAAVASLFAYQLSPIYPEAVEGMVPVVFAVIVGTVAIYGLTAAPLAHWLGLADPDPEGLLFVGASGWVRTVAQRVQALGTDVYLIDNNVEHVRQAREEGLPARQANALSESVLDEVDLSGIGRLLITIPNDEVASLSALHFSDVFDSTDIYQLAAQPDSRHGGEGVMPKHLRGRPLFGESTSYQSLAEHMERGDQVTVLRVADEVTEDEPKEYYTYEELTGAYNDRTIIPLFVLTDGGDLEVVSETGQFRLRPTDRMVALVGTGPDVRESMRHQRPNVEQEGDGLLFEVEEVLSTEEESSPS